MRKTPKQKKEKKTHISVLYRHKNNQIKYRFVHTAKGRHYATIRTNAKRRGKRETAQYSPIYREHQQPCRKYTLDRPLHSTLYIYLYSTSGVIFPLPGNCRKKKKKLYLVSRRHNRFPAITAVSELPGRHVRCPVEKAGAFFFSLLSSFSFPLLKPRNAREERNNKKRMKSSTQVVSGQI